MTPLPLKTTTTTQHPEETRMGACIIILCPLFLFFLFFWCHLLTLWFTQDAYLFRSGLVSISDAVHCKTVNVRSLDPLTKGMMRIFVVFLPEKYPAGHPKKTKRPRVPLRARGWHSDLAMLKMVLPHTTTTTTTTAAAAATTATATRAILNDVITPFGPCWPALMKPVLSFFFSYICMHTCFLIIDNLTIFDRKCWPLSGSVYFQDAQG